MRYLDIGTAKPYSVIGLGTWQSFDVDFTAPAYRGDKKVKDARLSVLHNGVKIHDDVARPLRPAR